MDIKTVLLCKIKPGNRTNYNNLFKYNNIRGVSVNNFVAIGNYDALMVYDTKDYAKVLENNSDDTNNSNDILRIFEKEKTILTKLYCRTERKGNADNISFYHPLHIICNKNQRLIDDFWGAKKSCFAMVLIYGSLGDKSISELEDKIKQNIDLDEKEYLIYRSVNLSELVLLCKHNSLKIILDSIAAIDFAFPSLQTHTICAFRYDYKTSNIPDIDLIDDTIDMVKISGTINDPAEADFVFEELNSLYNKLPKNKYLAFGNNDFNLVYKLVSVKRIVLALNCWFDPYNKVHTAFYSVKTRVHKEYLLQKEKEKITPTLEVQTLISETQKNVINCFNKMQDYTDWICPFIETLNMLSDMCANPALYRIRYYVIDTLKVFNKLLIEQASKSKDNHYRFLRDNEQTLNTMASGLGYLIEYIVRVDGYLSQEPGYSPLIYNMVPAGILEYYCAFIHSATEIVSCFSDKGDGKEYYYATLPLPVLKRYIYFLDIVPQQSYLDCEYQVSLIGIPHKQLYHPKQLLFSVMHEIMHFCGNKIRCRDARYNCYISFLAKYITYEFDLGCIYGDAIPIVKTALNHQLSNYSETYFEILLNESINAVNSVYENTELKNKLLHILYERKSKDEDYSEYEHIKWVNKISEEKSLLKLLGGVEYLFRECYADLMTVIFLNIDPVDYCNLVEAMYIPGNIDVNHIEDVLRRAQFELRKALVVYTIRTNTPTKCGSTVSLLYKTFCFMKSVNNESNIISIVEKIRSAKDDNIIESHTNAVLETFCKENEIDAIKHTFTELFFNIHCIMCISDYLNECYKKFRQMNKNSYNKKEIEKLRAYYRTGIVQSDLFSDNYCNFIYHVREEIDKKIK